MAKQGRQLHLCCNSAAYIGDNPSGASTYDLVQTAVDQVRIYNRALSLTEIQAVANSSYP